MFFWEHGHSAINSGDSQPRLANVPWAPLQWEGQVPINEFHLARFFGRIRIGLFSYKQHMGWNSHEFTMSINSLWKYLFSNVDCRFCFFLFWIDHELLSHPSQVLIQDRHIAVKSCPELCLWKLNCFVKASNSFVQEAKMDPYKKWFPRNPSKDPAWGWRPREVVTKRIKMFSTLRSLCTKVPKGESSTVNRKGNSEGKGGPTKTT